MRIGVFGGSFDPPHAAHAALANAARAQLGLDKLLWVPTAVPAHKAQPATPFVHRLNMTRALVTRSTTDEVSDIEATLPQPSYTLRTLHALKEIHGAGHSWYLVLGSDNWANFSRWHKPKEVMAGATLAVFPRPGFPVESLQEGAARIDFPEMPHQSSALRTQLGLTGAEREEALRELPQAVSSYIREHGLYQEREEQDPA